MGRVLTCIALMTACALPLGGCGLADSHAVLPDFMRTKDAERTAAGAGAGCQTTGSHHLDSVFMAQSAPQDVRVSQPHRDLHGGPGWTACVKAGNLTSATGKPLGVQIYRITIEQGVIMDRQRIVDEDNCVSENYEPI